MKLKKYPGVRNDRFWADGQVFPAEGWNKRGKNPSPPTGGEGAARQNCRAAGEGDNCGPGGRDDRF